MAYDFVPKSVEEIYKNKKLGAYALDMVVAYSALREIDIKIEDPISIDVDKKMIKILPSFEKKISIPLFKSKNKLKIKISFGRGTRGIAKLSSGKMKPGKIGDEEAGNKGIIFEKNFTSYLDKYYKSQTITDINYKLSIEEINKKYKLKNKDVQIIPEGALNKRRPITFVGDRIYVGGNNFNIGATVTDITLRTMDEKKKQDYVYLSLKYGNKVTFFNVGVGKILPKTELEKGELKNQNGKNLIDLFGIDVTRFCAVFNMKNVNVEPEEAFQKIDIKKLQELIKSGIGYGYYLVHMDNRGKIHGVEMTQSELEKSSKPQSCKIIYGGASGQAKRVDVIVDTPMFTLTFNFRNKARGGIFPSHLMCDYVIKHH